VGDELYGKTPAKQKLALRAVSLSYVDPFTQRRIEIRAPTGEFLREHGYEIREFEADQTEELKTQK
jgi:hypothetical protein